jgi:hypothetical protein
MQVVDWPGSIRKVLQTLSRVERNPNYPGIDNPHPWLFAPGRQKTRFVPITTLDRN